MNAEIVLKHAMEHPWYASRVNEYYRWYPKTLSRPSTLERTARNISGFYVHVPFCEHICSFCTYNKRKANSIAIEQYVRALLREIHHYSQVGAAGTIEFIYFGGGTPSALSDEQVAQVLEGIRLAFPLSRTCEVSFEMHPTHVTPVRLESLAALGVTRVSSGIQSLDDAILHRIRATHNISASISALDALANWNGSAAVDLLYRCPGQDVDSWCKQLDRVIGEWRIPHISCYSLYLEDEEGQPTKDADMSMAAHAMQLCEMAGLEHYASCASGGFDVGKPDHLCEYEYRHWAAPQTAFLGIGAGALGYIGTDVTANISDIDAYSAATKRGLPLCSSMAVTESEAMHRYMVLGAKTLQIPKRPFFSQFGIELASVFEQQIENLCIHGMLREEEEDLHVTDLGRLFVDQISSAFWSESERDVVHPDTDVLKEFERTC
jgi:oxygen-independent coproporphyrinogen-3 oxidase